jgi:hypothetical protein
VTSEQIPLNMSPRWYIQYVTYDINIFYFNSRINIGRQHEMIVRDGVVFTTLMTAGF